jgi:hypothetical protein
MYGFYSCAIGQSDWSEIDQAFSSDDEELFSYFDTSTQKGKAQSAASNDALSDRPDSLAISKTHT